MTDLINILPLTNSLFFKLVKLLTDSLNILLFRKPLSLIKNIMIKIIIDDSEIKEA